MRVAAIYDIHGNLPALEAVLDDIRRAGVDRVVVGGDVVPGPMPRKTLACLLGLDVPVEFIRGNGEAAVPEQAREPVRWTAEQLRPEDERLLAGWPMTLRLEVGGVGAVLFCHATPRSDTEVFTRLTPEDRLVPVFGGLGAPVVVCGHTHMPFDRTVGPTRVVNAGSVGMPYGRPGADWLLLGPDVRPRHTDYDLDRAAGRITATSYPQAAEFAARHVLEPPSEGEILALLATAELR
jgi:putative phosphoesterase